MSIIRVNTAGQVVEVLDPVDVRARRFAAAIDADGLGLKLSDIFKHPKKVLEQVAAPAIGIASSFVPGLAPVANLLGGVGGKIDINAIMQQLLPQATQQALAPVLNNPQVMALVQNLVSGGGGAPQDLANLLKGFIPPNAQQAVQNIVQGVTTPAAASLQHLWRELFWWRWMAENQEARRAGRPLPHAHVPASADQVPDQKIGTPGPDHTAERLRAATQAWMKRYMEAGGAMPKGSAAITSGGGMGGAAVALVALAGIGLLLASGRRR